MTRVLQLRHGTTDEVGRVLSGRAAVPLNDEGRREAARLGGRLELVPLGAIYTSPAAGAAETAAVVAHRHGLAIDDTAGPPWS